MQEYKIRLTWEAIQDVTDIAEYIADEFGMEKADQFQNDMYKQLKSLCIFGKAFGRTDIYYRNYRIYKKLFLPSIIFYIVDENLREIHILRILREEQDWAVALVQRQSYTYPGNDTKK